MEIRQLEYFTAVAETGSFTQAAEACHVVQTTISHAIAALEGELSVKLFVREGHRVTLTAEGRALLDDARSIVDLVRQVEQGVRQRRETGKRALRLGYYGNGLGDDFPAALKRFRQNAGASIVMCGSGHDSIRGDLVSELKRRCVDAFLIARAPIEEELSWTVQEIVAYRRVFLAMSVDDELAGNAFSVARDELRSLTPTLCMFRASSMDEYGLAMRGWLARDFGVDSSRIQWVDSMEESRLRARCGQCRTFSFKNSDEPSFREGDLLYRRVDGMERLPITFVRRSRDIATDLLIKLACTIRAVSSERGIPVLDYENNT